MADLMVVYIPRLMKSQSAHTLCEKMTYVTHACTQTHWEQRKWLGERASLPHTPRKGRKQRTEAQLYVNLLLFHLYEFLCHVKEVCGEVVVLLQKYDVTREIPGLLHPVKYHVGLCVCVCVHALHYTCMCMYTCKTTALTPTTQ